MFCVNDVIVLRMKSNRDFQFKSLFMPGIGIDWTFFVAELLLLSTMSSSLHHNLQGLVGSLNSQRALAVVPLYLLSRSKITMISAMKEICDQLDPISIKHLFSFVVICMHTFMKNRQLYWSTLIFRITCFLIYKPKCCSVGIGDSGYLFFEPFSYIEKRRKNG